MLPPVLSFLLGGVVYQLCQPALEWTRLVCRREMLPLIRRKFSVLAVRVIHHLRVPFGADMPGHQVGTGICGILAARRSRLFRDLQIAVNGFNRLFDLSVKSLLNSGNVSILLLD
ncbi:hypothetical protein D3C74_333020 [compost metagenome]